MLSACFISVLLLRCMTDVFHVIHCNAIALDMYFLFSLRMTAIY